MCGVEMVKTIQVGIAVWEAAKIAATRERMSLRAWVERRLGGSDAPVVRERSGRAIPDLAGRSAVEAEAEVGRCQCGHPGVSHPSGGRCLLKGCGCAKYRRGA